MSNYRKLFIYKFATSRYFRPVLSVYFLSLAGNSVQQVGIYVSALLITGFIVEVPSGYIGDTLGHKTTLALAQVCFIVGILLFVSGTHIGFFIAGCIVLGIGRGLDSGTCEAYFYDLMVKEGNKEAFGSKRGKFRGNIAALSIPIRIGVPMLSEISFLWGFYLCILFCIAGFFGAITLDPNLQQSEIQETKNIQSILKEQHGRGTYLIVLFFALISGVYMSELNYREPFVIDLGVSVGYLGVMIGISRLLMRIIGHSPIIRYLERLPLKLFMIFDMLSISGGYIFAGRNGDPYVTLLTFSCIIGYRQSRRGVISKHLLKTLKNRKYKATLLSIFSLTVNLIGGCIAYGMGVLMNISFSAGFMAIGIGLILTGTLYIQFIVAPREEKQHLSSLFSPSNK